MEKKKSENSKLYFAHGGGLVNICCLKAGTHMLSNKGSALPLLQPLPSHPLLCFPLT